MTTTTIAPSTAPSTLSRPPTTSIASSAKVIANENWSGSKAITLSAHRLPAAPIIAGAQRERDEAHPRDIDAGGAGRQFVLARRAQSKPDARDLEQPRDQHEPDRRDERDQRMIRRGIPNTPWPPRVTVDQLTITV